MYIYYIHYSNKFSYRFQKLVWSPLQNQENSAGIIAAGCESGQLQLYSVAKLLAAEDALVASQDKHTGNVDLLVGVQKSNLTNSFVFFLPGMQ